MDSAYRNARGDSRFGICWLRNAANTKNSHCRTGASSNANTILKAIEAGIDFHSQVSDPNIQIPKESVQRRNFAHLAWGRIENDYYQYQQGLMSQEVWKKSFFQLLAGMRTAIYGKFGVDVNNILKMI